VDFASVAYSAGAGPASLDPPARLRRLRCLGADDVPASAPDAGPAAGVCLDPLPPLRLPDLG